MKKTLLAALLLSALLAVSTLAAPPQADEILTGTVLKLLPKLKGVSSFLLRVDSLEASAVRLAPGHTVKIGYSLSQVAKVPGLAASADVGRGELVKVYARRAGDRFALHLVSGRSSLVRLGRGELVAPAARADEDLGDRLPSGDAEDSAGGSQVRAGAAPGADHLHAQPRRPGRNAPGGPHLRHRPREQPHVLRPSLRQQRQECNPLSPAQ